jgi:RNA polymerase sigma-70 factor (ECF subfamily)
MSSDDFEQIVSQHYKPLYRFALSLTGSEADACDLTQQTFYVLAAKGHQLRDRSKVKGWLFTTLHREFLSLRKRETRFPHVELDEANEDVAAISVEMVHQLDAARLLECLGQVQEPYRAALGLFYLEDYSYKEIADILHIPLGTVRSRISRGMTQLQGAILVATDTSPLQARSELNETKRRSSPSGVGSCGTTFLRRLSQRRSCPSDSLREVGSPLPLALT